jgi:hypothetical protein
MVRVGRHRLEVTVSGSGLAAVVIEPCFGGWARDWRPIAEALAEDTTVVIAEMVQSARTGAPPGEPVAASDGD